MFILHRYKMRFTRMVSRRIENYKRKTMSGFELLFESIFKGGMFGLVAASIVWISIFLYVVFYYLYMPSLYHTRPVHFQFSSCETEKGVCSFPAAHVQLTKKQQLLMIGQRYKIYLNLEMPESPANVDLVVSSTNWNPLEENTFNLRGMFMVCTRMVDQNGILVSNSCRSTMLHYRSQFLKLLLVCANSPFLIFGSREEKQVLTVELYSDFEEHQSHPVTDIYVEIQSRFIELYSASIHIQAHLTGLRYLMFHWPLISAILGVLSNLFVITFIFALSWYHLYIQNEQGQHMFINFIKQSLSEKIYWRRDLNLSSRDQGYIEELDPAEEKSKESRSSSESEESKSEFFKEGTSQELGYYLDGDD